MPWLFGLLLLLASLVSGVARADQPTPDAIAAAELAFEAGKRLAQQGDYPAACQKFEESQRLAPGSGTQLNLADCYENLGRTASAWTTFRAAAAAAAAKGNAEREAEAEARAAALIPRLSTLRIEVTSPVDGIDVRRGDVAVPPSLWNTSIPVDPGPLPIRASAPKHVAWSDTVTIPAAAGETEVTVPALKAETAPVAAPAPRSDEPAPPPEPKVEAAHADDDTGDTQRIVAYVIGGAGIVALFVGTGAGIAALQNNAESKENGCEDNLCPPDALLDREKALGQAHLSTAMFVLGIAALGAATVVFLTAPEGDSAQGARAPRVALALDGHALGPALRVQW